MTSPKMVKNIVAQAPKRYEWSPYAKTDKRLLLGEDDDDMLLLADQVGSCESISFREAMDLVDGNGNENKILVKGMEKKVDEKVNIPNNGEELNDTTTVQDTSEVAVGNKILKIDTATVKDTSEMALTKNSVGDKTFDQTKHDNVDIAVGIAVAAQNINKMQTE